MPSLSRPRPDAPGAAVTAADALGAAPGREIHPPKAKGSPWGRIPVAARRLILLVAVVGLWQLYVSVAHVSPLVFASPADVASALWTGWTSGTLASATLLTLKILAIGMGIGMAVAAVLTTLATWTRIGEDVLVLFTSMLNPLPSIAILPLAILWFGLSETALIVVIANAVTWPIAINVSMGFRTVNPTILSVGRNIGLRGWRLVRDVLLPAALPHTIAGLKTGWAFGWRTIIAAELVFGVAGGGGGLGNFINKARYFLQIPDVFAGLVTIALIGIALEWVFTLIERRTVVRWGMKSAT
jgi:NitT/TauT family transport system permease protein